MKYRRTNRAKRISGGCRNHGTCGVCTGNRLHQAERAVPADEADQRFDAEARSAEKQASRDEDARRLESGEVTREELKLENGAFAFPPGSVRILAFK